MYFTDEQPHSQWLIFQSLAARQGTQKELMILSVSISQNKKKKEKKKTNHLSIYDVEKKKFRHVFKKIINKYQEVSK